MDHIVAEGVPPEPEESEEEEVKVSELDEAWIFICFSSVFGCFWVFLRGS